MTEDQAQTHAPKICLHCGTENEWRHGQCISCGRTSFLTPEQYAKNRRSGVSDIIYSVFLVGIFVYLISTTGRQILTKPSVFALLALSFVAALVALFNSFYKYKYAKDLPMLRPFLIAFAIIYVGGMLLGYF